MRFLELEVVAAASEKKLGIMNLTRMVFTADIFSAGVLGRPGGFCGVTLPVF